MENVVLLFACLTFGILLRASGRMPENGQAALNTFIINISLPALILSQMHAVRLDQEVVYAAAMPWLLFIASALLFWLIGYTLNLPRATVGALAVVGGLGNTSFIGLPMIESYYGAQHMPIGIIADQLGSYLVLSTIGIMSVSFYGGATMTGRDIIGRIIKFPPLIALAVAIACMSVNYPGWFAGTSARLGNTLAPLALVSVGLQLRLGDLSNNWRLLAAGLGYKLVLAPILILFVYAGLIGLTGSRTQVILFESAMPPMIGGSIIAVQYGLNPQLISLMVGVGTVLSFLTLPLWWYAFGQI